MNLPVQAEIDSSPLRLHENVGGAIRAAEKVPGLGSSVELEILKNAVSDMEKVPLCRNVYSHLRLNSATLAVWNDK
jgi:hypothetical protein